MNYIQQINSFWDKHEVDQDLKATSIAIYNALLQINNRTGWKDKFRVTYGQVLSMVGITKNTYYAAISELVKGGYIEYEKGPNQYQAAIFRIIVLNQNLVQHRESTGKALGTAPGKHRESTGNILKQVNNKTIKHKNIGAFIPPTIEDVKKYFFEKGYSEQIACRAWDYYNSNNWHDQKGNKVLSWKQKMIAVWFKEENRIKETPVRRLVT